MLVQRRSAQSSTERFHLKCISLCVDKLWPTKQYPNLHFKIVFLPSCTVLFMGMLEVNTSVKCNTESKLTV